MPGSSVSRFWKPLARSEAGVSLKMKNSYSLPNLGTNPLERARCPTLRRSPRGLGP
jgi:hypothetical protein